MMTGSFKRPGSAIRRLPVRKIRGRRALTHIHNSADIAYVKKGGVLYDGTTLDQVWPKKIPFGENYWVFPPALLNDDRPTDYWDHH